MKLINTISSISIAILSIASVLVRAEAHENAPVAAVDTPVAHEELKQYVVTFQDDVSLAAFDETLDWIKENKGEIVESINENFAKLIIAKMDNSILKLTELKPKIVEAVEVDDLEWDDNEHVDL